MSPDVVLSPSNSARWSPDMAMAKNGWNMDGIPLNGWLTDMCVALLLLLLLLLYCFFCCCYIYEYIRNCISVLLQVTYVACQGLFSHPKWRSFEKYGENLGKWRSISWWRWHFDVYTCVYHFFRQPMLRFSLWLPISCLLSFLWTMTCWWLSHHLGIFGNILL